MEHTKGKVKIGDANLPEYAYYGIHGEKYIICDICSDGYDEDEQNANANIIIDAFNTTNESGLTPSQLHKQNQELLYALKELVYELTGEQECEDELEKGLGITLAMRVRQAQQAINNAKTK